LAPVIPTRLVCFDEAGGAAEINWREFRINRGEIGREEESRERAGRGERGDAPREARPYRRRRKVPNGMEVKRKLPGVWLLRWPARSSVAAAVTCTATGRPCGASASSTRRISASVSDHSATHACEPTSLLNQLPHSAPRSGLVDTHNIRSTGDNARSGTLRCAARRVRGGAGTHPEWRARQHHRRVACFQPVVKRRPRVAGQRRHLAVGTPALAVHHITRRRLGCLVYPLLC
jgi:hypothetical protein